MASMQNRMRNFLALNDPDPKEMTVVDHLDELRHRLIVCIATVTLFSVGGWFLVAPVYHALIVPLLPYVHGPRGVRLVFETLTAAFFLKLKIAVAVGIAVGLPVLLYQTWMFIAPAVSVRARHYAVPFVLMGMVLFIIGGVIGYFVFPRVVGFLVGQGNTLQAGQFLLQMDTYVSQFALVIIVFGAVFEMPVVFTFLAMIGVVTSRFLRKKRKYAAMLGLIAAMIITPGADPITPFVTAAVVYLLYEFSIILIRAIHR